MTKLRSYGMMIIISSPSGAGKSSLSKALVAQDNNLYLSVSATTRSPRPGEVDGEDYHFMSRNHFNELVSQKAFLEYAEVFEYDYGTLASEVEDRLSNNIDVIFDIDWQGAQELRSKRPKDIVSIYILPPSLDILKERLTKRCQDDKFTINRRMARASEEISHYDEYDYVIVNDDFDDALQKLQSIITAERSRLVRQSLLPDFANKLL